VNRNFLALATGILVASCGVGDRISVGITDKGAGGGSLDYDAGSASGGEPADANVVSRGGSGGSGGTSGAPGTGGARDTGGKTSTGGVTSDLDAGTGGAASGGTLGSGGTIDADGSIATGGSISDSGSGIDGSAPCEPVDGALCAPR
jgi:hypothetical protein